MKPHFKVTRDCLLKYIFGNPGNTGILISLVNSVLKDSGHSAIKSARIENPFNIKEFKDDKESVIDIRAKDETGRIYNIEIQ
ncbi:MAG: PD-(D/E)XK nuclease family transposase [Spirochaetales bacterium]|nr:PD-(D/E)XK nuclease family transposase [Spirochaetales bacterium]